jgi:hypothetical protein
LKKATNEFNCWAEVFNNLSETDRAFLFSKFSKRKEVKKPAVVDPTVFNEAEFSNIEIKKQIENRLEGIDSIIKTSIGKESIHFRTKVSEEATKAQIHDLIRVVEAQDPVPEEKALDFARWIVHVLHFTLTRTKAFRTQKTKIS